MNKINIYLLRNIMYSIYKNINFIAIIITLLTLILSINVWYPKGIQCSFEYESQKIIKFTLYYAEAGKSFQEENSIKVTADRGSGKLVFVIPSETLGRIRIDPGSRPGYVCINNIAIENNILNIKDLTLKNIDSFNIHPSRGLQLNSKHVDPELIYKKKLTILSEHRKLKEWNFILICLTPFYLVHVIYNLIKEQKSKKNVINTITSSSRLYNLEALRVLFTIGICLAHFLPGSNIWNKCDQGVEFFFILSGYLLALSYRPERSISSLMLNRYVRFVPLVVFGCILCGGEWTSFYGLFLCQGNGLAMRDLANSAAWYINVLFWLTLFYLSVFKALLPNTRKLLIGLITFLACTLLVNLMEHNEIGDKIFNPTAPLRGLVCMGIGILVKEVCVRKDGNISFTHTIAETVILFYIIWGSFDKSLFIQYWIFIPISLTILLGLFIQKRGIISHLLEHAIFATAGRYCLAVYLTHWSIQTTCKPYIMNIIKTVGVSAESVYFIYVTVALVAATILGVLSYHLIEKPCAKYFSHIIKQFK